MYVIQRDDGAYVARRGSQHSYTRRLENAQTYRTRETAEGNRCPENEHVVSVDSLMGEP